MEKSNFENVDFVRGYLASYSSRKDKHSKALVDFLYRMSEMPYKKAKEIIDSDIDKWGRMWPFTEANEKFDNVSYSTILAICHWILETMKSKNGKT